MHFMKSLPPYLSSALLLHRIANKHLVTSLIPRTSHTSARGNPKRHCTTLAMPTKPVYQYDEALRTHVARVIAVTPFDHFDEADKALFKSGGENTQVVETNETIFYAQGGGQPFDTGDMTGQATDGADTTFEVQAVRNAAEGKVLHFGIFKGAPFDQGSMVEQRIDSERRDANSRSHTAGHTIGLAVRRLAEKTPELNVSELKAQHYPDASFVEFKGTIDGKFKDAIQEQASAYVKDALPIKLYWFKPDQLAENGVITADGMPIVAGQDGHVRVVDIVGAGAYPCGGTHVPDTSYIGQVVVKGIKRQKGISKVSYTVTAPA